MATVRGLSLMIRGNGLASTPCKLHHMKCTVGSALIPVILLAIGAAAQQEDNPCKEKQSNADLRNCYWTEQIRINRRAESLAREIEVRLRKDAKDTPQEDKIVADLLRKAAKSVARSQNNWRGYRDQHCNAVMHSWTIGSGAGTAYEACMYAIGKARVKELNSDFPNDSAH